MQVWFGFEYSASNQVQDFLKSKVMKRDQKGQSVKEQIANAANAFIAQSDKWTTAATIQQHTELHVKELCQLANLKCKIAQFHEPQSDQEEVKDGSNFEKEIVKEIRKFMEGLKNLQIVQKTDIQNLKALKANAQS